MSSKKNGLLATEETLEVILEGLKDKISTKTNVEADFLTSGGFGNLRYHDNKFQYFNKELQEWVDTTATPDNILVVNMTPASMKSIYGVYDNKRNHYKLKWEEPADTVVNGQLICAVESVMIRRKLGEIPENENDGDLVKVIKRKDFGNQVDKWYVDISFTPELGDVYYYKAFPMSNTGIYNTFDENATEGILAKDYDLYGMIIDNVESNPNSKITWIEDCKFFTNRAYMDFKNNVFVYGDWNPEDVFFMDVKPCMLHYDGTVAYYLDPNDYSLKEDGTPSDYNNPDFDGNCMVERPCTWVSYKVNGQTSLEVRLSNKKVDETYHAWKHMDINGNVAKYVYDPVYEGVVLDGKLRSLSGYTPSAYSTGGIKFAVANDIDEDHKMWYIRSLSDWILDVYLVWIIGKSTNSHETFGYGNCDYSKRSGANSTNCGIQKSGLMDQKGLFFGNKDYISPVKMFGIENLWGSQWNYTAGLTSYKGIHRLKLTRSRADGTEADDYNLEGDGYKVLSSAVTPSGNKSTYITKAYLDEWFGMLPLVGSGSASTYYPDGIFFNLDRVNTTLYTGGCSAYGLLAGIFCANYQNTNDGLDAAEGTTKLIGISLYCKPIVPVDKEVELDDVV